MEPGGDDVEGEDADVGEADVGVHEGQHRKVQQRGPDTTSLGLGHPGKQEGQEETQHGSSERTKPRVESQSAIQLTD